MERQIIEWVNGRILPYENIPFNKEAIEALSAQGELEVLRGVERRANGSYICRRCRNEERYYFETYTCAACGERCTYCVRCFRMGRISSCSKVVRRQAIERGNWPNYEYDWNGTYSYLQQRGADALVRAARENIGHLIYAVCGAGKTEMIFAPIDAYLKEGKQIAVVSPRVDVILELAPRFEKVFRGVPIQVLYGGAEDRGQPFHHAITLATTHQLFHYDEAFDAIFVDEADAFPYTYDIILRRNVEAARKKGAPIHAITATPTKALEREYRGKTTIIPSRFHGHPLPLPTFHMLMRYEKALSKGKLPRIVVQWVRAQIDAGLPFLLFFHSIEAMEGVRDFVQRIHPTIEVVHSESAQRKEFVQQLRDGERVGLCTTTILERGVTIPKVQVAVLGAEQPIFTKEALIQIGGRVGRSKDHPTGDFVLFHAGWTRAMKAMEREIKKLNRLHERAKEEAR